MLIPARSKRQVMDWSLVLASQDISATIVESEEAGWGLLVEPHEYERALNAIKQYRLENRRWRWRQPLPGSQNTFHWGSLFWALWLILVHGIILSEQPQFRSGGQFETRLVRAGQWWRAFSAISLHADLAHLLANVTVGILLLGLAMGRYGAGVGLLAAYVAGAGGNVFGLLSHAHPYIGVGASGMVMGALGLIAVPRLDTGLRHRFAWRQPLQALGAAVLLFVLLGVDPKSDVLAHLGGFITGALLGFGLNLLGDNVTENRVVAAAAWLFLYAVWLTTTWLALKQAA